MENAALFSIARPIRAFSWTIKKYILESIKAELMSDEGFSDETLRCQIYARSFRNEFFVQAEYDALWAAFVETMTPIASLLLTRACAAVYGAAATARSRPAGKTVSCQDRIERNQRDASSESKAKPAPIKNTRDVDHIHTKPNAAGMTMAAI